MKESFTKIFTVFWKDMLLELRGREIITSVLVFGLLMLVIFSFAFESGADAMGLVAPGILWVAYTFAGVLALNRTFAMEKENLCLEGLMLCPVERHILYWGKLMGNFTFMLLVAAIITPIFLILFNLPIFMPWLALVIVLATLGFVSVGTLFSALAANTKSHNTLLPILFFPIVIPVIIAAVEATGSILNGESWGDISTWIQVMIAFDVIFLVVSALVFEFVIEE
jgi:heme exporter protein B